MTDDDRACLYYKLPQSIQLRYAKNLNWASGKGNADFHLIRKERLSGLSVLFFC